MKYRASIEFEVDAEALTAHDGEHRPPPNSVADWDFSDLFAAHDQGIVTDEGSLISIEEVADHEL